MTEGFCPATFTELDCARHFVNDCDFEIAQNPQHGWCSYSSACGVWETAADATVSRRFGAYADKIQEAAAAYFKEHAEDQPKKAEQFTKFALSIRSEAMQRHILALAKSMCQMPSDVFDCQPEMLNTRGGAVNLKTGETMKHSPLYYNTKIAPSIPATEGRDVFQLFLDEITCGDRELSDYLQFVAGCVLFGTVYEEKLFVLLGSGANGKSTFCDVLMRVLGTGASGYATKLSAEAFCRQQYQNIKPQLATLRGTRLAVASEIEHGAQFSDAAVKQLVSRDAVLAEAKYCAPETFQPSHTTLLTVNEMPSMSTSDYGMRRRITVIPFKAQFVGTSEQKNIAAELVKEAGGAILQWMLEGAKLFAENGFSLPSCQAVEEATSDYFATCDSVSAWLKRYTIKTPTESMRTAAAYGSYVAMADSSALNRRAFRERLLQEGFTVKTVHGNEVYSGLSAKTTA